MTHTGEVHWINIIACKEYVEVFMFTEIWHLCPAFSAQMYKCSMPFYIDIWSNCYILTIVGYDFLRVLLHWRTEIPALQTRLDVVASMSASGNRAFIFKEHFHWVILFILNVWSQYDHGIYFIKGWFTVTITDKLKQLSRRFWCMRNIDMISILITIFFLSTARFSWKKIPQRKACVGIFPKLGRGPWRQPVAK